MNYNKGVDQTEWIAVRIGSSRFALDEAHISNLLISCAYLVQAKLLDSSISMEHMCVFMRFN